MITKQSSRLKQKLESLGLVKAITFSLGLATMAAILAMPLYLPVKQATAALLTRTLENYVVASYEELLDKTDNLESAISDLCSEANEKNLLTARAAFADTVSAWSLIEWFHIGPVLQNNRRERFFFSRTARILA